jgi:hypothetical protein
MGIALRAGDPTKTVPRPRVGPLAVTLVTQYLLRTLVDCVFYE